MLGLAPLVPLYFAIRVLLNPTKDYLKISNNEIEYQCRKLYCFKVSDIFKVTFDNHDAYRIHFKEKERKQYSVTVLRCGFDGKKLTYLEHGSEHTVPVERGFAEPSITCFRDRYFLTLRNDRAGYVTVSDDGLHFAKPRKWFEENSSPP